jgi:hypothetical protein
MEEGDGSEDTALDGAPIRPAGARIKAGQLQLQRL